MIKNRLILTRNLIGMGVIEIEYELNKIMYSPKVTKNPISPDYTFYNLTVSGSSRQAHFSASLSQNRA